MVQGGFFLVEKPLEFRGLPQHPLENRSSCYRTLNPLGIDPGHLCETGKYGSPAPSKVTGLTGSSHARFAFCLYCPVQESTPAQLL